MRLCRPKTTGLKEHILQSIVPSTLAGIIVGGIFLLFLLAFILWVSSCSMQSSAVKLLGHQSSSKDDVCAALLSLL